MLVVILAAPGSAGADRALARARHLEARSLLAAGEPARAAGLLDQAIAADQDYLPAYEARIPLWIEAGELAPLVAHLERVTARHPDFAPGWYALGYAYRSQGRDAVAVLAYQSYLALRPGEAAPWFGFAVALQRSGQSDRARAAFRRYLDLERDPAMSNFTDQARRQLAALSSQPADTWIAVGEVALARGQASAARAAFAAALEADPQRTDAVTGLAAADRALGRR